MTTDPARRTSVGVGWLTSWSGKTRLRCGSQEGPAGPPTPAADADQIGVFLYLFLYGSEQNRSSTLVSWALLQE